ncbi:unnamed protein product [Moneuplotes crassus]|uniref:F-box domain-containing protein n=1 Tax=Euplotes crassus TaxID=5936 RepID=A0AAD1UI25_EUPCR|nr:unnamed protein product [Moneuplotes crassus]
MKLLNTVLREILLFLEFKDIVNSGLPFVSKIFYQNIVQDNEVFRRMVPRYVALIKDNDQELAYYNMVMKLKESDSSLFEQKTLEDFDKFYENSKSKLWDTLRRLEIAVSNEIHVELFRVSGAKDRPSQNRDLKYIFSSCSHIFYSRYEGGMKNKIFCATGIMLVDKYSLESESSDEDYCEHNEGDNNEKESLTGYVTFSEIKNDFARFTAPMEQFNPKAISKCQIFSLDSIPLWNKFKVFSSNYATQPIKTFAIFVHDFPLHPEDHPLSHIVKESFLNAKSTSEQSPKTFTDPGIFSQVNPEEIIIEESTTEADQDYIACFTSLSDDNLVPKIVNSNENLIEFDQHFYCDRLEETKGDVIGEQIDSLEISELAGSLHHQLDDKNDYFRLRLAAIAYDLNTMANNYEIKLKQQVPGRYVTIIPIDVHDRQPGQEKNYDIGGITFYGNHLKGPLVKLVE